jgi:endonuclease/exonuclease/phosphatase family metal-dependent hydrolase
VQFTAIAWNLFHGRDFPPDPSLLTWRSRLLRTVEQSSTHIQINRDLEAEFAALLRGAAWDVALLQEAPPRFSTALALACGAEAHRVLTSRNRFGWLRGAAARFNPDLIASAEGGSNLTLIRARSPLGAISERREAVIHTDKPERRTMAMSATASGICIANLHATNDSQLAASDVRLAAAAASEWAGERPLLFGGDLNARPAEDPELFEALHRCFGLAAPTAPAAIDHLLVRGLQTIDPPAAWPAERRELREAGRALRLSDHTPVQAKFCTASAEN